MEYASDGLVTLHLGDVRDCLRELPAASVHVCVTSPPYWGMRTNKIAPVAWGGDPACDHQWGDPGPAHHPGQVEQSKRKKAAGSGRFCLSCRSWLGELGLEPSPALYVQHLVEVMREVRRALRDDGTLFLNLGDSWAGSGGAHRPHHANPGISRSAAREGMAQFQAGAVLEDPALPVEAWDTSFWRRPERLHYGDLGMQSRYLAPKGLKPLDLVGIPWAVAFALRADGWYLRSDNIWAKVNGLPESVNGWRWERHRVQVTPGQRPSVPRQGYAEASDHREHGHGGVAFPLVSGAISGAIRSAPTWGDCPGCPTCSSTQGYVLRKGAWRPTKSHEYVFLFSKSPQYYADLYAAAEPLKASSYKRLGQETLWDQTGGDKDYATVSLNPSRSARKTLERVAASLGDGQGRRNIRSVWAFATTPYAGAHFSTFPPRLPELAIQVGSSEAGVCGECGAPWARVVHRSGMEVRPSPARAAAQEAGVGRSRNIRGTMTAPPTTELVGWLPTCGCGADLLPGIVPATVLDPFVGSGTTLAVTMALGRRAVGIDAQQSYLDLACERIWGGKQRRITGRRKKEGGRECASST